MRPSVEGAMADVWTALTPKGLHTFWGEFFVWPDSGEVWSCRWVPAAPTIPTQRPAGVTGFAVCSGVERRIHVCAFCPCMAVYPPSKQLPHPPVVHVQLVLKKPGEDDDEPAVAGPAAPEAIEAAAGAPPASAEDSGPMAADAVAETNDVAGPPPVSSEVLPTSVEEPSLPILGLPPSPLLSEEAAPEATEALAYAPPASAEDPGPMAAEAVAETNDVAGPPPGSSEILPTPVDEPKPPGLDLQPSLLSRIRPR